jgi:hypothetical protein
LAVLVWLLVGGAILWYEYGQAVDKVTAQADLALRRQREATGEFRDLQGNRVTRFGGRFIDAQEVQTRQFLGRNNALSVNFNQIDPLTGQTKGAAVKNLVVSGNESKSTTQTITEVDRLRERLKELNREIKVLGDANSQEFKLRIQVDEAEETRKILQELIDLRRELLLPLDAPITNARRELETLKRAQEGSSAHHRWRYWQAAICEGRGSPRSILRPLLWRQTSSDRPRRRWKSGDSRRLSRTR